MSFDVVNGYICRNCTDVDYAKRHIDPAHPHDGPYGANKDAQSPGHGPAVVLGGSLAKPQSATAPDSPNGVAAVNGANPAQPAPSAGPADDRSPRRVDLSV